MIVEPSEPLVLVYHLVPHGEFKLRSKEVRVMDASVELQSVTLTLTMTEICDGLDGETSERS